ncbi:ABC transporter [Ferrithrix thermotolerans DSM 19514]|uniref:ABC transporter n=1 Tax=Ferrithrix thermotolerans DSM 19514 TaxID=1121881 RepID=A0A1M4WUJ7_9ACTN|nr:ABC transporter ATP-binding protein [Ferrithrix thermotolerans]SHE84961.1 ABC transporter [Ferrithrix thermotolerans DSM 19514]
MTIPPLYELEHLSKSFHSDQREVVALSDISLVIEAGDSLAVIGESGSGKSTLVQILCGLTRPTSGEIRFQGQKGDIIKLTKGRVQLLLQDPKDSFDPTWTVGRSILEPLHLKFSESEGSQLLAEAFEKVGLSPVLASRRPSELSGGQLQRASIARALTTRPDVLVADEPLSSLDVVSKLKIVDTIQEGFLRDGGTLVIVSHDLSAVRSLSKHTAVILRGELIEYADTEELFESPNHPYTKELILSASSGWM